MSHHVYVAHTVCLIWYRLYIRKGGKARSTGWFVDAEPSRQQCCQIAVKQLKPLVHRGGGWCANCTERTLSDYIPDINVIGLFFSFLVCGSSEWGDATTANSDNGSSKQRRLSVTRWFILCYLMFFCICNALLWSSLGKTSPYVGPAGTLSTWINFHVFKMIEINTSR